MNKVNQKKNLYAIQLTPTMWAMIFACFSMFALGLSDNIRGPLFSELIKNFQLTNTQASLTYAISSLMGFVGNAVATQILKKVSLHKLLIRSVFVMGMGLFCLGFAPGYVTYLLSMALFGFSMGLLGVAQNLIVSESFEPSVRTKALSGLHSVYGLSSLVAPFVVTFAFFIFNYWKSAFFVAALFSFLICIGSLFFLAPSATTQNQITNEDAIELTERSTNFRDSYLMQFLLGGVVAFYVVAEILISSRLAFLMNTKYHFDLYQAGLYVTYFFIFLLAGRVLFTFVSLKFSLAKQLLFLLSISLLFLFIGLNGYPFFIALTGLPMSAIYPLSLAFISETAAVNKRKYVTFAIAFQNVCVISMHVGVGYLTDSFGVISAFGVGLVSLLMAMVCVLGVKFKNVKT